MRSRAESVSHTESARVWSRRMRNLLLFCAIIVASTMTSDQSLIASDSLDALGYRYPKHRFSLKNLRPHYDDREKAVIPADQPVPRNWVVVGHRKTHLQISSTVHQLIVQKLPTRPGAELSIWKCQPLPFGWAVVSEFTSNQFPGKMNMLRIRKM